MIKSLLILGENFINSQNTYTASSGAATANLYDQDQDTVWASSGSSEGATETIEVAFLSRQGVAVSRTIDRIILLNTNLSKFYFESWNGSAWVSIAESVHGTGTENADASVYVEIVTPIATTKIRLTATNTISAVAEKSVGEMKACLLMSTFRHRASLERSDWDDGQAYRLQGGSLVSFQNTQRFEASAKLYEMSLASYELIRAAIYDRAWMTWVLWEDFRRADIYEVMATEKPTEIMDRKTSLYELSFRVRER